MGPEATTALMKLVAIKPLAAGHPVQYATLSTAVQAYQDRTKGPPVGNQGP